MVGCELQSGAGIWSALSESRRRRGTAPPGRRRRAGPLVGLEDFADTAGERLAYGHRRLLEMARALAARPRLLLLDEPAAGLVAGEIEALAASASLRDGMRCCWSSITWISLSPRRTPSPCSNTAASSAAATSTRVQRDGGRRGLSRPGRA